MLTRDAIYAMLKNNEYIQLIKEVRSCTTPHLGLKEAKDMVDAARQHSTVEAQTDELISRLNIETDTDLSDEMLLKLIDDAWTAGDIFKMDPLEAVDTFLKNVQQTGGTLELAKDLNTFIRAI